MSVAEVAMCAGIGLVGFSAALVLALAQIAAIADRRTGQQMREARETSTREASCSRQS
jgi:hypothetical protein